MAKLRVMVAMAFGLGAAPLLAQPLAEAPAEAEDLSPEEIAIARDRYERMTVPVTIGGSGPFRFFIDTGAQATVVTRKITDELQLAPTGSARLIAMGSSKVVQTFELDDLQFANRNISGLVSPLLDNEHIGADGILGLDSLQDLRVLIDFREKRLTVADAEAEGSDNGYEIVVRARRKLGQMVITDARVNNVRTTVIIDTGAQNSIGNAALFDRLRARPQSDTMTSTDVHGFELTSDVSLIKRLSIGGMELTGVPIGFTESPVFAALGLSGRPAVILGMGSLRIFERIAIDFSSRKVLFDLPNSASFHDPGYFPTRVKS